MLLDALIPPQPVRSSPASGRSSSQNIFRSNLTSVEYRYKVMVMATTNFASKTGGWFLSFIALLLAHLLAPIPGGAKESPAARVERTFFEAQARFNKNNSDPEAAWQFGRACFDWSDLA